MPDFEERLDQVLLTFEQGAKPARALADALFADFPERSKARAIAVAARIGVSDFDAARAIALGDDGLSLAARGLLLAHDGEWARGIEAIEQALRLAPDDPIVVGIAAGIVRVYDPERGLALARRGVELRPHDPGSYARLASSLASEHEWEELRLLREEPPPAFAGSPSHTRLRASHLKQKGDLNGAREVARELVAQVPDGANAWGFLALLLNSDDQRTEAETAAFHALDLNPRQSDALLVLSRSAESRGDEAEARRLRELRRKANPLADAMKPLYEVRRLYREGKIDELIRTMDRFEDLPPVARPSAFRRRIKMLTVLHEDDALRRAVEAAALDDDVTTLGRAELLLRENRFDEAWALLEPRWVERRPSVLTSFVIRALGGCNPEAARQLADELIETPPSNVLDSVSTLHAMIRSKVMIDRLWPFLNAIERKYPSSQPIRELKAGTLLRMGRFEQADRLGDTLDVPRRERFRIRRRKVLFRALTKALWRRAKARWKRT